ncbi:MAG: hypothetical protein ACPGVG_13380 [Mycobacterium sp.]
MLHEQEYEAQTMKSSGGDADGDADGEVVLSDAERRNGWTADALRAYHAERTKAAAGRIFRAKARPQTANSRYRVFRWRA